MYLFIVAEMATARQAAMLLALLMAGAAVEALVGLVQFALGLGPEFFAIGRFMRAYGTFEQPNPYAGYLGMLIPLASGCSSPGPRGGARAILSRSLCSCRSSRRGREPLPRRLGRDSAGSLGDDAALEQAIRAASRDRLGWR